MKKSIFKRIGLIALAVCVAIGSFFVPLKSKKQNNFASANNSSEMGYQFSGSELLLFSTLAYDTAGQYIPRFVSFKFEFITGLEGFSFAYNALAYSYSGSSVLDPTPYYPYDDNISDTARFFTRPNFDEGYSVNLYDAPSETVYIPTYIKSEPGFVANCKSLHIFTSPFGTYNGSNLDSSLSSSFNSAVINIEYVDFNNKSLLIQILSPAYFTDLYSERTYYFIDNFTDNDIYYQGYQQGLADNQQIIYNNGYDAGFDVGYGSGKSDGILSANDYSFIGLIGAVIDVPVQTFMSLLNFTFLGVNLFDFVCAILTFLLIIFVIKLFIGGK